MLQTTRSLGVSASLALALAACPVFGDAYQGSAYEGFDYTAGNLTNTFSGGTGWNATGDADLANTTTWGITTSGNGTVTGNQFNPGATAANQQITAGGSARIAGAGQIGRHFGQTVDAGTLYFSYRVQKTVDQVRTVNLAFFGETGTGSAPNERVAIGQIASNVNLKNSDGTPDPDAATKANKGEFAVLTGTGLVSGTQGVYTSSTPQAFALNQSFLIVGKIQFNVSGTSDRLQLYIDPASLSAEPSLAYIDLQGVDFGALTGFRMFAGGTSGGFTASAAEFDEIRFGTNYLTVTGAIPEPSTAAALLGLAGLGFAALRRRRA